MGPSGRGIEWDGIERRLRALQAILAAGSLGCVAGGVGTGRELSQGHGGDRDLRG
jgi:hypothetical protein